MSTDPRPLARSFGSEALTHLGSVSVEYAKWADGARAVLTNAAQAEAEYRSLKAKAKLTFRTTGGAKSDAEAETRADADAHVAMLLHQRLVTRAIADSHLEKLRQLRSQNENGRTYASTERTLDQMHAQGRAGAA